MYYTLEINSTVKNYLPTNSECAQIQDSDDTLKDKLISFFNRRGGRSKLSQGQKMLVFQEHIGEFIAKEYCYQPMMTKPLPAFDHEKQAYVIIKNFKRVTQILNSIVVG
ncbi:hypothetical protein [Facilibium subflavum]|uniref:hypothetical protein n=1 Tax=Facilibium subflavum TaxID=2219058 RepID=UPI001AAC9EE3|nr:hypothetical protein [Facilibium subflavum]